MKKAIRLRLFDNNPEVVSWEIKDFNFEPLKKLTAMLLVFLFVFGQAAPALAQQAAAVNTNLAVSAPSPVTGSADNQSAANTQPTAQAIVPTDSLNNKDNSDQSKAASAGTNTAQTTSPADAQQNSSSVDLKNTQVKKPAATMTSSDTTAPAQDAVYNSPKPQLPEVESNTGALTYSYAIAVPPGRNNLQPDLKLNYNSQNRQEGSPFGYGWSISIPYIQRLNKFGVDRLYGTSTPSYFSSFMDGELATTSSANVYTARTDNGNFNSYSFSNNQWLVTDKNGTQYKFGYDSSTQQNDQNNPDNVFKWMLQEVRDTNNNYISYSYYKDSGQIYPESIKYTGNGTADGIFEVDFLRGTRADNATSSASGFAVASNYRVNEIDVKINGDWVTKYALAYTTNGNEIRSLLSSIIQSGQDSQGNITTLPPTSFTYQSPNPGWTESTTWTPVMDFLDTHVYQPTHLADVNGDSLPDFLYGWPGIYAGDVNNSAGWTASSTWNPPINFMDNYGPTGWQIADLNGDGRADFIYSNGSAGKDAFINNGNGWTEDTSWDLPGNPNDCDALNAIQIVDLNGDGLPDVVFSDARTGGGCTYIAAYINNGHGWTQDDAWHPPMILIQDMNPAGPQFIDVNGDGLPDLVYANDTNFSGDYRVYINNGHGWTQDISYHLPMGLTFNGVPYGVQLVDVNGDGLPDFVYANDTYTSSDYRVYINNGHGWTQNNSWNLPRGMTLDNVPYGVQLADVNGDGLPDYLYGDSGIRDAYINHGNTDDLLTTVTYPQGGNTTVTYKPASQYTGGAANVSPYVLQTVQSITTNDGGGNTSSFTYTYQGGTYRYVSQADKEFAGFNLVSSTDSAGNLTNTYYHTANGTDSAHGEYQDNFFKIGKPYRVEQYDNASHLQKKTINKWDSYAFTNPNAGFVKLAQTVESDYSGTAGHKDKAESYTYDNGTGNQIQKIEYGQVNGNDDGSFTDTGTDDFTTNITYASGSSVIAAPADVIVTDHNSNKVKESQYYYDNLGLGSISLGNRTQEMDWKTGTSYAAVSQKTYNSYGLVTQSKDGNGNPTNYSYDSYNLYPAIVTNALSQPSEYTYNYVNGKAQQTTDPNGNIFNNTYDGLGRPLLVYRRYLIASSRLSLNFCDGFTGSSGAVRI